MLKCKHCGYETDSEKIFYSHEENCLKVQEENGLTPSGQKTPKTGYEAMDWNDLKKHAASKGVDVKGKKKEDILQALKDLEGDQNDNNSGKGENDPSNSNDGQG